MTPCKQPFSLCSNQARSSFSQCSNQASSCLFTNQWAAAVWSHPVSLAVCSLIITKQAACNQTVVSVTTVNSHPLLPYVLVTKHLLISIEASSLVGYLLFSSPKPQQLKLSGSIMDPVACRINHGLRERQTHPSFEKQPITLSHDQSTTAHPQRWSLTGRIFGGAEPIKTTLLFSLTAKWRKVSTNDGTVSSTASRAAGSVWCDYGALPSSCTWMMVWWLPWWQSKWCVRKHPWPWACQHQICAQSYCPLHG